MRPILIACAAAALALVAATAGANPMLLAGLDDRKVFTDAIEAERPDFNPPIDVSGITVPHHLVAADLIARGFWAASGGEYRRVIVLAPDHFRANATGITLYTDPIETVFGPIMPDTQAIDQIATAATAISHLSVRGEIDTEHGVLALAPFVKSFFPRARIVPVVFGVNTKPEDWAHIAGVLAPLIDDETLVVQSTDFSHYLPIGQAVLRDQETINVISAHDRSAVERLDQPAHLDSRAAMSVMMDLLVERLGHHQTIIANRNQVEYEPQAASSTTSYLTIIYTRDARSAAALAYDDQHIVYFGGDVYLGRFLTPALLDEHTRDALVGAITQVTRSRDLIVNLEGALLPEEIAGVPISRHRMSATLAMPVLTGIKTQAASLANNHSHDLGIVGYETTLELLAAAGITALRHGRIHDLGAFRLLAMNFIKGVGNDATGVETGPVPDDLCLAPAAPPLIALVHWGTEFTDRFDEQTRRRAGELARCGVSLIIGSHSHRAPTGLEAINGNRTLSLYSLGNLAFDQLGEDVSGALLEMRIFHQGTVAARLIPIENLYRMTNQILDDTVHRTR